MEVMSCWSEPVPKVSPIGSMTVSPLARAVDAANMATTTNRPIHYLVNMLLTPLADQPRHSLGQDVPERSGGSASCRPRRRTSNNPLARAFVLFRWHRRPSAPRSTGAASQPRPLYSSGDLTAEAIIP